MKNAIAILVVAALAGAGTWWYISSLPAPAAAQEEKAGEKKPAPETKPVPGEKPSGKASAGEAAGDAKPARKPRKFNHNDPDKFFVDAKMTAEEKNAVLSMRDALDEDDFESVVKYGRQIARSSNPEVREAYIEALGWFGEKAMAELTPFMGDPDESVADAATLAWQEALGEIEDEKLKVVMAEEAMKLVTNKIALDMLGSELTALDDDVQMFEAIIRVIEEGNSFAAAKAREIYHDETGEEWTDIDAAEAWLQRKRMEDAGIDPDAPQVAEESVETAATSDSAQDLPAAATPDGAQDTPSADMEAEY